MKYLGIGVYIFVVMTLFSGVYVYQKTKHYPISESVQVFKKALALANDIHEKYEYFNN